MSRRRRPGVLRPHRRLRACGVRERDHGRAAIHGTVNHGASGVRVADLSAVAPRRRVALGLDVRSRFRTRRRDRALRDLRLRCGRRTARRGQLQGARCHGRRGVLQRARHNLEPRGRIRCLGTRRLLRECRVGWFGGTVGVGRFARLGACLLPKAASVLHRVRMHRGDRRGRRGGARQLRRPNDALLSTSRRRDGRIPDYARHSARSAAVRQRLGRTWEHDLRWRRPLRHARAPRRRSRYEIPHDLSHLASRHRCHGPSRVVLRHRSLRRRSRRLGGRSRASARLSRCFENARSRCRSGRGGVAQCGDRLLCAFRQRRPRCFQSVVGRRRRPSRTTIPTRVGGLLRPKVSG
jgi:hypothetical protein